MHAEMLFIPLHPKKRFSRTFESPCDCLLLGGTRLKIGSRGVWKVWWALWILNILTNFVLREKKLGKSGCTIVEQFVDLALGGVGFGQGRTGQGRTGQGRTGQGALPS